MKINNEIDDLIKKIDQAGGPDFYDFEKLCGGWLYKPKYKFDYNLDPLSSQYFDQMLEVYEEIAGQKYNVETCEMTHFSLDDHLRSNSPYGPAIAPKSLSLHYERLSRAFRILDLPAGSKVLDMGAGWGLSSEFFSHLGFDVYAVDINPNFIELITLRSKNKKNNIKTILSSFQNLQVNEKFDAIIFYECFHHETKPWELIARLKKFLKPDGRIILLGEPIQENWRSWGLRLDALSIYCIRKFGWFESGWTEDFLRLIFNKANFTISFFKSIDQVVGSVVIAKINSRLKNLNAHEIYHSYDTEGWILEGDSLISNGNSFIEISVPMGVSTISFDIDNYRGANIKIIIRSRKKTLCKSTLKPGKNQLPLKITDNLGKLYFISDIWCPKIELGGQDERNLSFHLKGLNFK